MFDHSCSDPFYFVVVAVLFIPRVGLYRIFFFFYAVAREPVVEIEF